MRIWKRTLFYLILIFTFAFTFSQEESKITIFQKKNEPAKLKIGVTKLKTKELNLDFNAEEKTIFGYLPDSITDSHLIFVSETLDEMPSVSTTNGRKSINNIKKYLTKDIKVTPKFTYQVLTGDDTNGLENGKKYLSMNCNTMLSGVYMYVVEKGSYHVKEIYKGKFNIPTTLEERELLTEYGTIVFSGAHELDSLEKTFSYDGTNILCDGVKSDYVTLNGVFPKKRIDTKNDYTAANRYPSYRIFINGNLVSGSPVNDYVPDTGEIKNTGKYDIRDKNNELVGKIEVFTESSEYLKFKLKLDYRYAEIEKLEIEIQYGRVGAAGVWKDTFHKDKFNIQVNKKPSGLLPVNTSATVLIDKEHKLNDKTENILTAKGSDDNITLNGEKPSYLKVVPNSSFPKKSNFQNIDFLNGTPRVKIIMQYGRDSETGAELIKENIVDLNLDGTFGTMEFAASTGKYGKAGKIEISSETDSNYLKVKLMNWKVIAQPLDNIFKIQYISEKNGVQKILKEDELNLRVIPIDERIPENTSGTLIIHNTANLNYTDLYTDSNGKLMKANQSGESSNFDPNTQATLLGKLPIPFTSSSEDKNAEYLIDWGTDQRVLITDSSGGFSGESAELNYEFDKGKFENVNKKWIDMKTTKGTTVGYIYFYANIENGRSMSIGFRGKEQLVGYGEINIPAGELVNTRYTLEYQANYNGNWVTKKKDTFELIIQSSLNTGTPTIEVKNPIVMYDYGASSKNNIKHDRRARLFPNSEDTLNSDGTKFTKNTTLIGEQWIDGKDIPSYNYEQLKNHKIRIVSENGEVIKYTDANGKTLSSTFVKVAGNNRVMFSYDGNSEHLNFGVSKYNFDGGEGTVTITHFAHGDAYIHSIRDYKIILPKFEGRPYINPGYNIKAGREYTYSHTFDQNIGNKEIIIEYGTVGFKDLDTRITNQSGGKGIELRANYDVILRSLSNPNYQFPAQLYFENVSVDEDGRTSFKGENEKATYKKLMLKINSQELISAKDVFEIFKREKDGSLKEECPLEVGVQVNNEKDKYFESVVDHLYLELIEKRFVETILEFENPNLSYPANGDIWIRLNKSQYPSGEIFGDSNNGIWGSVKGDVIDIPTVESLNAIEDKKIEVTEVIKQVFKVGTDGKEQLIISDLKENPFTEVIETLSDGSKREFIIKYPSNKNYIEFILTNGYDLTKNPQPIEFYIRYLAKDKESKEHFLFDHRYRVLFKEKKDYAGETIIHFKNPMMVTPNKNTNFGKIRIFGEGSEIEKGNNQTYDRIQWWEVKNPMEYPNRGGNLIDDGNKLTVKTLGTNGNELEGYLYFENDTWGDRGKKRILRLGLPNNMETLKRIGLDISSGKAVEADFEIIQSEKSEKYKLTIKVDEFDPTYYGMLYPSSKSRKPNYSYNEVNIVGSSTDETRKKVDINILTGEEVYIDLGTKYRDLQRYGGIVTVLNGAGGEKDFKVGVTNKVEILPKDNLSAFPIIGTIVFENNGQILEEKQIDFNVDNNPTEYFLKVKLSKEEYKKLQSGTVYEIYQAGAKDIINIGYLKSDNKFLQKKFKLNEPLNFTTAPSSFEIEEAILDFGKIGVTGAGRPNIIEKSSSTVINVKSKNIENFKLELENDNMVIYKLNNDQTVDTSKSLNVKDLKVEEIISDTKEEPTKEKKFNLSGVLEVPNNKDTELGNYEGFLEVKAVIISD